MGRNVHVFVKGQGACIRGGDKEHCPASLPSAGDRGSRLTASRWNVERPKQEPKPTFFTPSLSAGGSENQSVCAHCGGWVWLFVSAGGGREAGRQRECIS